MSRYINVDDFVKWECNSCDGHCNVIKCDCKNCHSEHRCDLMQDFEEYDKVITVPDNPTNGDIIKAWFPETLIYVDTALKIVWFCIYEDKQDEDFDRHVTFPLDWWNAPYKVGTTATPIPETPTADWVESMIGLHVTAYKCSKCGRVVMDDTGYDVVKDYPYCNCGAKIKGVIKKCEN